MIFICVKFPVRPEHADQWPLDRRRVHRRRPANEPGCLWFDWSRSLDDTAEYVLVEAFRDGDAGAAHVGPTTSSRPRRRCRPTWPQFRRSST